MDISNMIGTAAFSIVPPMFFRLVFYVLTAYSLYTMAKNRGLQKAWLAWIPVLNLWIVGSLSDQYRYVVRGQIRSRRILLLILSAAAAVVSAVMNGTLSSIAFQGARAAMAGVPMEVLMRSLVSPGIVWVSCLVPYVSVAILKKVISYMALYDIYNSSDPANSTVYIVFSILFGFTKPFFLFACRNLEKGMPPRKDG